MMRFDLVVALRAEDGIPSKGPEALGLVFFLQIYQFARIAPPLLVFRAIVVFNESQRSALVLNQMSANRSKCRSSVMRTGEINLLVHCFESMRPSGHVRQTYCAWALNPRYRKKATTAPMMASEVGHEMSVWLRSQGGTLPNRVAALGQCSWFRTWASGARRRGWARSRRHLRS